MSKSEIEFRKYVVKSDGLIDVEATVEKFSNELNEWVELQSKDRDVLLAAIEEVFADAPGATLNGPAVRTLALAKVGFTTKNYQELTQRCAEVMKEDTRFYTIKGPTGGSRIMTPEEHTTFLDTGKNPYEIALEAKKAEKAAKKAK